MINEKEKEFVKDIKTLLEKYNIDLNACEQYGGDECWLGNDYLFEDYGDFRLEIDELMDCIAELRKEEEKKRRKEEREKQRQKLRNSKV
jgi:hypothetical protein